MDQFPTAIVGGYRKDMVDERLKRLVTQIEELQSEVQAAKEREEQLKEALAASQSRAEILETELEAAKVEPRGEPVSQQEESLKEELAAALKQLEMLSVDGQSGECDLTQEVILEREKQRNEDLSAAIRWSESLEAELKLVREERNTRAQNRLLEVEHIKALNQRILDLEADRERREAMHRRELARLQEQMEQQSKGCEAAGRILELAEKEASTLVEEAQKRAQQLEQQAEDEIYAKKKAAAQALEGARTQVIHYLETFTITREKLAVTYNELDALVGQIPTAEDSVIELEHDSFGDGWGYTPDMRNL